MAYKSNFPGTMIVKLGDEVDTDTYEVSASFNEIAAYAAGDGIVYLFDEGNGVKIPLSGTPSSHEVTFGNIVLTYSDDNVRVAVLDNVGS